MLHQDSSNLPVCQDDPGLSSIKPAIAEGQHQERNQLGTPEESTAVEHGGENHGKGPDICKPGKRETLAGSREDGIHSKPAKLHHQRFSSPPQQPLGEGRRRRLQIYASQGEKLSNVHLSNPEVWLNIGYIRAGWVPSHLPFLPSSYYWKLKANSTVVSTSIPPPGKDKSHDRVPCGVTCYMHSEGPWCEIQTDNGTLQCLLAARPTNSQGPPGMRY